MLKRMRRKRTHALVALALVIAVAALNGTIWPGTSLDDGARAAATPACFGAAARDPEKPCVNPQLDSMAIPAPEDAVLDPSAPCTLIRRRTPEVCTFGASRHSVRVALLGDSHAVHWRAALTVVARAAQWRGVSITRSQCPFSLAKKSGSGHCVGWVRRAIRWLKARPKIHTIIVSGRAGSDVLAKPGRFRETKINGYIRAWKALPASVHQIVVIHDVPLSSFRTQDCIEKALAAHQNPGVRCARPRRVALVEDLQTAAAKQLADDDVDVVDLTPFMCDADKCFPVVGGALVNRDKGHLTRVFSTSLGPFLGRAMSRLGAPS